MKPKPNLDDPEAVTVECDCGRRAGLLLRHWEKYRCECGLPYWALRPKANGPLVLVAWPGKIGVLFCGNCGNDSPAPPMPPNPHDYYAELLSLTRKLGWTTVARGQGIVHLCPQCQTLQSEICPSEYEQQQQNEI